MAMFDWQVWDSHGKTLCSLMTCRRRRRSCTAAMDVRLHSIPAMVRIQGEKTMDPTSQQVRTCIHAFSLNPAAAAPGGVGGPGRLPLQHQMRVLCVRGLPPHMVLMCHGQACGIDLEVCDVRPMASLGRLEIPQVDFKGR